MEDSGQRSAGRRWLRVAVLAAVVGGLWFAARQSEFVRKRGTVAELRGWVAEQFPWSELAYVGVYVAAAAAGFPGVLVSAVGATLFGMWKGTALTLLAGNLAAWPPYLLARWAAAPAAAAGQSNRMAAFAARHGFVGVFVLRLVPVPYNLVNFLCGFARARPRDYLLGTLVGMVPGTMVYQYLFAEWGEAALDRGLSWAMLAEPRLAAPLGLFAAFVLLAALLGRKLLAPRAE